MKAQKCHLEQREGNWVTVTPDGKARPSTKTELFLWGLIEKVLELQKEHSSCDVGDCFLPEDLTKLIDSFDIAPKR